MQRDARSPRELSAHGGIGIVSDQVESEVSRVARGVGEVGGGGWRQGSKAPEPWHFGGASSGAEGKRAGSGGAGGSIPGKY